MTPDDVRAAAEQLVEFHDRFAPLFGKTQAQDHAYTYLKGLMCCPERKSIEPIALCVGEGQVSGLQKFIAVAPWAYDDVQAEAQALFAERFVPAAFTSPIGVVGVVDESAFAKKGTKSAGVARQHNGRVGKEDNCQVGVFLIGVAPEGVALLDHRLYLHQSWYEGETAAGRRDEAHIPDGLAFRTKPEIAAELIRDVAVLGIVEALDWVVADAGVRPGWARSSMRWISWSSVTWRKCLQEHDGLDGGPCGMRAGLLSGRGQPAEAADAGVGALGRGALAAALPQGGWQRLQVHAKVAVGPLVFEFAAAVSGLGGPAPQARPRRSLGVGPPGRARWRRPPRSNTTSATATRRPRWASWRWSRALVTRSRISSRTPRATWVWHSTRRVRGWAGTIT